MKTFEKSFINEITNEKDAAVEVERYRMVSFLLKEKNISQPKLLKCKKTSIILEYVDLPHKYTRPNFERFHNITTTYYRHWDMSRAECRLKFITPKITGLHQKICNRLIAIALESIEKVNQEEDYVFLHMDPIYKNYFSTSTGTVWIDFQDAMMGPKSLDEVHYLIDCFSMRDFDVSKFTEYQQKSAVYNSIRQYGIFSAIPRFRNMYINVTKYNVNKILKELEYDLEIT